ncbi:MAG: histidine kinase [Bacteroidales bacterium]|nr:histidine kinase [Bacteroidales bacterium]
MTPSGIHKNNLRTILITSLIAGFIIPTVYGIFFAVRGEDPHISQWFSAFFYSTAVTFLIFKINSEIVHDMQVQLPWFRDSRKRFFIELLLTTISAVLIITIFHYIISYLSTEDEYFNSKESILENAFVAAIANFVILSFTEGRYFLEEWKKYHLEAERLKRLNLEIQYQALARQIDPHFLFNSLNVLVSLISEEPAKAVEFTREFSRIYRYVLDVRNKYLVQVREVIDFLQSYLFLHRIRFGDKLISSINLDAAALDKYLPPLSLQLLAENAIKNNEISDERPLRIELSGDAYHIVIRNSYQPRPSGTDSAGTGLENLRDRYVNFGGLEPTFAVEDQWYIARIPLIEDE